MTQRLNTAQLIESLAESHGMLRAREILCVWAGLKSARVGMAPADLPIFIQSVQSLGLAWCCSSRKYLGKRDIGKGGWSNKFGGIVSPSSRQGDWLVYVARDAATAEAACSAEESNREFDFGSSLGIPDCCARFYLQYQQAAQAKQNDYVPFVLDQTSGNPPYDFRLNYVAQYFGYSLISFFPCSFRCPSAVLVAQRTLELLSQYVPRLATETVRLQRCPVLYTEYNGIYLFEKSAWDPETRTLRYDPTAIRGTLPPQSAVFRKLRDGDTLAVLSTHTAKIKCRTETVAVLGGDNVSICLF